MQIENNEYQKSPKSKYKIALLLGIISFAILGFYFYTKNKIKEDGTEIIHTRNRNSNNNKTISTPVTTAVKTENTSKSHLNQSKNEKYYLEILKKYLEKINKNDEVKVYINENGDLRIEDFEGNFLSIYGLSHAEIFSGDINNDDKSESLIQISNSGGGGGGNIVLSEIYLINNEEVVSEIDQELINPPKNEFGYSINLIGIENDYVIIDFIFRNENDNFYAMGKVDKIKCQLINNKFRVVN